jgi:hypothetical protein
MTNSTGSSGDGQRPPAAPGHAEAAYWAARADELAEWAWDRLINRTDGWGGYFETWDSAAGRGVTRPMTRPRVANRGQVLLTPAVLVRHFGASRTRAVAGLHTTSPTNTCRWGALDIDRHGAGGPAPETTRAAALHWFERLCQRGFRPLLTESNGRGGYHLRIIFSEPVPSPRVFALMRRLVADYATLRLPAPPEAFPKQATVAPPGQNGQFGNWLRLPGRHHSRDYWGRVWDGEHWLGANRAIDHILALTGDSPSLVSAVGLARPAPRRMVPRGSSVPVAANNLPGRIAAYLAQLPNLGAGEGRDDVAYHFAAFLVRDLALPDDQALAWLERWDSRNAVLKGRDALAEILAHAHQYGRRAYGCGLTAAPPQRRRKGKHRHIILTASVEVF